MSQLDIKKTSQVKLISNITLKRDKMTYFLLTSDKGKDVLSPLLFSILIEFDRYNETHKQKKKSKAS